MELLTADTQFQSRVDHFNATDCWIDSIYIECLARDFSLPLRLTVFKFETIQWFWWMKAHGIVTVTFSRRPRDVSSCVCSDKVGYLRPKRDLFLSLVFFVSKPNQSISTALSPHNLTNRHIYTASQYDILDGISLIFKWLRDLHL